MMRFARENQWDLATDLGKLDLATKEIMMPNQPAPNLVSWASEIDEVRSCRPRGAARLPIVAGHVALMPDAHVGIGATVGSVIPTEGAIIPAAVGVDIGCGMIADRARRSPRPTCPTPSTPLLAADRAGDPGRRRQGPRRRRRSADRALGDLGTPAHRARRSAGDEGAEQFGTLGSGNHFVEVCLDERDRVWIVLHSGSRGIGNQLATKHIADGQAADEGAELIGSRTRTSPTSWRARRSSTPTSPTCCGRRTTPWPTATR